MLYEGRMFNLWSATTLLYAVLLLTAYLVVKTLLEPYVQKNIPPFPAVPYPIVGHLLYVKDGQRKKLNEFRKKAGDIFSLYFGSQLFVIINGTRLIKEALIKHGDTLSDRPPVPYIEGGDMGIVFANGSLWKEQRSASMAVLRSFGMGKTSKAQEITDEVNVYLDTLAALKGEPQDVRTLTGTSIANVICSIIVGERFDYDEPLFKDFVENFTRQIAATENINPVTIWPWLRFFPGNFFGAKTLDRLTKVILDKFCDRFIELSLAKQGEDGPENFITSYLHEMENRHKTGKETTLSRGHLRRILQQLFIAGTDTTTTTIMWFMLFMVNYPDIQEKVYEEIISVTGTDRVPDMQDRVRLPYTNAVIMETQRRSSIAPTSIPHYCCADTVIDGYTIPAGAIVLPSMDSLLLDEAVWEEPLAFRPHRFLNAEGNITRHDAFVPFGLGKRFCMGEALASMELFLYTTLLVQRFKLQPCEAGQPPPIDYEDGLVCAPKQFRVRFVEREAH